MAFCRAVVCFKSQEWIVVGPLRMSLNEKKSFMPLVLRYRRFSLVGSPNKSTPPQSSLLGSTSSVDCKISRSFNSHALGGVNLLNFTTHCAANPRVRFAESSEANSNLRACMWLARVHPEPRHSGDHQLADGIFVAGWHELVSTTTLRRNQ